MRKFLGFMVMVLFAFPLTVNAEDGEQVVENLVDEENIKNEEQEIPVIPEISTNDSVSDEEQVDEEGVDFFNGASARIAGTWIQDANGWWYRHEDGSYTKNNWENINGTWFYFDANGYMYTGWLQQGNAWYYLWDNGSMATTWANIDGTWYYFDPNSGAMRVGWLQLGNTWYYLWPNGSMATGMVTIENKTYYFDPNSGAMKTGWLQYGGRWYYFNSTGAQQKSSFKRDVAKDKIIFVVPDGGYSFANVEMNYTEEYIKVGTNSHYISHQHVFLMQALGATEVPGFDYAPIRYSDGKTATPMSRFDIIVEPGWDVICPYGNYNKLSYANNTSVYGEASAIIYCNGAAVPVVGLTAKINLKN